MRVDHDANGKVTITMLDKQRRSRATLLNTSGRALRTLRIGKATTIASGFKRTTNVEQTVQVNADEDTSAVDFGAADVKRDLYERRERCWHVRRFWRQLLRRHRR